MVNNLKLILRVMMLLLANQAYAQSDNCEYIFHSFFLDYDDLAIVNGKTDPILFMM